MSKCLALSALAALLCLCPAYAQGTKPDIFVGIQTSDSATLDKAVAMGAAGVVLNSADPGKSLASLSDQTAKHDLALWLGVPYPGKVPELAHANIEGLALIFGPATGEPIAKTDFQQLLARKRQGDEVANAIRAAKKSLPARTKLALCTDLSEIAPETSHTRYVPVRDLIRDGTLDVVCLGDAEGFNFHRLRLLRDAPLRAGILVDGSGIKGKGTGGIVSRAVLASLKNDTCDSLWLLRLPIDLTSQMVPQTITGYSQGTAQHQAIQEAIRKGELVIYQEVDPKTCNDQATIHGVGQSFIPSRDGVCPLIQIYAAIRGCKGSLPPPLQVHLRINDGNMPGGVSIAKTTIPASAFGHEPTYRWVNAYFDPPVHLSKGEKCWIYLPNAKHPEGGYVWRIIKKGASERGSAWSGRYKYGDHTWVFRVYLKKE